MAENNFSPNILLTETCNQNCGYCFAGQKMKYSQKKEIDLSDIKKIIVFLKQNGLREIRLMGGEPTLHSRFKEIIDFILSCGFRARLFTNGMFQKDLALWLAKKGGQICYVVNLTTPAFRSEEGRKAITENLEILKKSEILASITLDSLEREDNALIDFIKNHQIRSARLGIANNEIGTTSWLKFEKFDEFGLFILRVVDKLIVAGVSRIELNCGFTPCMFHSLEEVLKRKIIINGWGCGGKKSVFDVASDLGIFSCFILSDIKAENLFDFKNIGTAKKFLRNLLNLAVRDISIFKLCKTCPYFKSFECHGPCRGWVLNNSNRQKEFMDLLAGAYFKVIYKLLYFSRNWL